MMRGSVQLIALAFIAQAAKAEDVALPDCTNPDASTSVLYDAQDARIVNGINFMPGATGTTRFLDCTSGVGFEIEGDGSMLAVVDANGNDVTPPSALGIIGTAMYSDVPLTMADIMRKVTDGGFQSEAFDPAADCMCSEEMRHAMD